MNSRNSWRTLRLKNLKCLFVSFAKKSILPLAAWLFFLSPGAVRSEEHSPKLTKYDIATQGYLSLARYLEWSRKQRDLVDWNILGELPGQVGDWVTQFVDADRIVGEINLAMPINGQPPFAGLQKMVNECCAVLGVDEPTVFVRNDPFARAYLRKVGDHHFLVLTSGLLNLYEGSPDELRFIIGHQLGLILLEDADLKDIGYGAVSALSKIDIAWVPNKFQNALSSLAVARLCRWYREFCISADRAGLLCCGSEKTAMNALQRLLSGVGRKSDWIDPDSPDFDPDALLETMEQWEDKPFVRMLSDLQKNNLETPFIHERIAALRKWARSEDYAILQKKVSSPNLVSKPLITVIKSIHLQGLETDSKVFVVGYKDDEKIVTTPTSSGTSIKWIDIESASGGFDGQPIHFEVWSPGWYSNTLVGGFTIFPSRNVTGKSNASSSVDPKEVSFYQQLEKSWNERKPSKSPVLIEVKATCGERVE